MRGWPIPGAIFASGRFPFAFPLGMFSNQRNPPPAGSPLCSPKEIFKIPKGNPHAAVPHLYSPKGNIQNSRLSRRRRFPLCVSSREMIISRISRLLRFPPCVQRGVLVLGSNVSIHTVSPAPQTDSARCSTHCCARPGGLVGMVVPIGAHDSGSVLRVAC